MKLFLQHNTMYFIFIQTMSSEPSHVIIQLSDISDLIDLLNMFYGNKQWIYCILLPINGSTLHVINNVKWWGVLYPIHEGKANNWQLFWMNFLPFLLHKSSSLKWLHKCSSSASSRWHIIVPFSACVCNTIMVRVPASRTANYVAGDSATWRRMSSLAQGFLGSAYVLMQHSEGNNSVISGCYTFYAWLANSATYLLKCLNKESISYIIVLLFCNYLLRKNNDKYCQISIQCDCLLPSLHSITIIHSD